MGELNELEENRSEYEKSRASAKFWLRSEKGLQTQYTYGV